MEQNRIKSPVFWASLVAQILSIIAFIGLFEKIGVTTQEIETLVGMVLQVLVLFGVLNNPTNAKAF